MKNLHAKLKNHGKKVIIHLKRHHRKYLFGALCSGILALIGLHTASTINSTFADEDDYGITIVLQATATEPDQTLTINKYFANDYTVDRGDGTTGDLAADTTHTYSEAGTYNVALSLSGADRRAFQYISKPLVPTSGTTTTGIKIIYMPSLADGFGDSETNPGSYFFYNFNYIGALTSLPDNSFDISNITTVGDYFFAFFNSNGALTSLPDESFQLSQNLTSVGDYFFAFFNNNGALTSLPEQSFNTSKITTAGSYFFYGFNRYGKLISLPIGSFDTSNITTLGSNFFSYFNAYGALTSLPDGSFDTNNIKTVGSHFFSNFNYHGKLTSLPDSFTMNSSGASESSGYRNAFNSPNYTLNKNVSDLVSGIIAPLDDRNVFSDNQPGRCGVDSNWLESTSDACSITYNTNGGSEIANPTKKYTADTTGVVAGDGVTLPTRDGYTFNGWYADAEGGDLVEIVAFPDMDGGTLYAQWIDTTPPNCDVAYSTTGPTNQNVIATLTGCSEPVTVTNNDDSMEYTFENIGTFTFEFQDLAGNTGTELAAVTWIDKDIPSCDVAYSTTGATTGNVTATLTCEEEEDGDITVTNNSGNMEYTFENTGTFTFEFQDLAGNTGSAVAEVTGIDKVKPTCDVIYSTTGATTGNVVATLTGCIETITGTETQHTFTGNGTYIFNFQDLAGNTGSTEAVVTWIDKTKPTCDVAYNTTGATTGNVTATLTGCSEAITGTDTHHTFTGNGTYTFRFQDLDGNTGEAIATVTWIISGGNTTYFDVEGNIFRWNDLTICNPNKSGECITMMDRNLGATTNDISKTGSYGYHYQRGNNYGFAIGSGCRSTMSQCSDEVTYDAVIGQTSANGFGPNIPYSSGIFYKGHIDWASEINYNLRGGSGDSANNNYGYDIINKVATNMIGRQGPCPEGYHVPSMGERFKLLEYWRLDNNITGVNNYSLYGSSVIRKFQEDFKIPFAGVRYYENAKTWAVGQKAYLWSSSPSYVNNMIHIQSESISFRDHSSAYGESVRCFKNPYNTGIIFSISFDDNIKPGEYATFTVKVLKDGLLYNNYTGTVLFTLTDKNGGLVNKKSYTIYNSGRYTFETSDSGRKIFYNGLKVNDAGTYILEIRGLRDGGRGSNFVFVGGKHNAADFEYDTLKFNPNYSDEMNQAYQYARYFDITTKNSIKDADMYSGLNRIAMAKMLTNYAENVLGKDNFNTGRNCSFSDVSNSLDKDYDYGVTKACQLGIMGVNMPDNRFYPNGGVTRAEFATALSRLLYNTKDGTERYYSTHITKLRREGIITNTDPALWELRGYVMLMLKRVAENNDE